MSTNLGTMEAFLYRESGQGRPWANWNDVTQSGPALTGALSLWGIRVLVISKNVQCNTTQSARTDFTFKVRVWRILLNKKQEKCN